ncbi:hypothetical protein G6F55_014310 [Rhizopus delemar]|nr:hypothetical protein G6F55_014310 [Rhizopus delemar]
MRELRHWMLLSQVSPPLGQMPVSDNEAFWAFDQIRIDLALLVAPVGACRPAGIHQAPWRQRPPRPADGVGGGFAIVEVTVALDAVAALAALIAPVAVHIGR